MKRRENIILIRGLAIFLILFFSSTVIFANSSGLTTNLPTGTTKIVGKAIQIEKNHTDQNGDSTSNLPERDGYELIETHEMDTFVQPGKHVGMKYFPGFDHLDYESNHTNLQDVAIEAIDKAPKWMQPELIYTITKLSILQQERWANLILQTNDPYIDEVAFSIAHSSPQYLSSEFSFTELFTENAELIYQYDEDLPYVQVMDYGTSETDENYYSTTKYLKPDGSEIEVPKEIYYMYLVHPKITDEIATYIDPFVVESNNSHQNNITEPPTGYFWRDYLYNHADEGYDLLKDVLSECSCVYDPDNASNDVLHALDAWLGSVMEFTSNSERPHQPVRIYTKHIGRCGEHADMRAAIGRIALVPLTSILTLSGDHTWNEFWDERWIHWDGGNFDNPLLYENGWGTTYASILEIRSDGHLTSVSDKYSEGHATIEIDVTDANGNPVDGARVSLKTMYNGQIKWDNWGYTDIEGKYIFTVGEGRLFYARVDTQIGDSPDESGGFLELVETEDGGEYVFSFQVNGNMPTLNYSAIEPPDDTVQDYQVEVEYNYTDQLVKGNIIMDDIDNTEYFNLLTHGVGNYFTMDLVQFCSYESELAFQIVDPAEQVFQGDFSMEIPLGLDWYFLFDNYFSLNNSQRVNAVFSLYQYEESSADVTELSAANQLMNYPNPFNPETTIKFYATSENPEIIIYNTKGRKLRTLEPKNVEIASNSIIWDGKDDEGNSVTSGIYFCRLSCGSNQTTKKMILMK